MKRIGIKKYKLAAGLLLVFVSLFLTGCGGMENEERTGILSRLDKDGYIDMEDELELEWQERGDTIPGVYGYHYTYCNSDEELYDVCIQPHGEGKAYVFIFYDVEIGNNNTEDMRVTDYDHYEELKMEEQTAFFILKTYRIVDEWEDE